MDHLSEVKSSGEFLAMVQFFILWLVSYNARKEPAK
jgi:hypothetical protein